MSLVGVVLGILCLVAGVLTICGAPRFARLRGGLDMSGGERWIFGVIYIAVGLVIAALALAAS